MQKLGNSPQKLNAVKSTKPGEAMSRKSIGSFAFNNQMKKKSSAIMFFSNQTTN